MKGLCLTFTLNIVASAMMVGDRKTAWFDKAVTSIRPSVVRMIYVPRTPTAIPLMPDVDTCYSLPRLCASLLSKGENQLANNVQYGPAKRWM